MPAFPSVTRNDVDAFETRLGEALAESDPYEIEQALCRAMQHIERQSEKAGLNFAHTNNATSTAVRAFGEVHSRLRKVEQELAQLKSEQTA